MTTLAPRGPFSADGGGGGGGGGGDDADEVGRGTAAISWLSSTKSDCSSRLCIDSLCRELANRDTPDDTRGGGGGGSGSDIVNVVVVVVASFVCSASRTE